MIKRAMRALLAVNPDRALYQRRSLARTRRCGTVLALLAIGACNPSVAPSAQDAGRSSMSCLERPAKPIAVPGPSSEGPLELAPDRGVVLDLRGVRLSADPPRNPLMINRADDVCVVGPTVIGSVSRGASWTEMKHNHDGDGVLFARAIGAFTLEDAWIENVEDAVGPPKAPDTPRTASFTVRGVYACYIRDDFVENDAALPL